MFRKAFIGRTIVALSLVVVLLAIVLSSMAVIAAGDVQPVVDYDPPYLPEGIAIDKSGNIYVGLNSQAEVHKITPAGAESVLTTLPLPPGGLGVLGLAVDAPGHVYAALATFDGATGGVYRIDNDGTSSQLPGSEAMLMPNAMVFDKLGNLYVTDSALGMVWRIPRGGSAEPWLQDASLEGTGIFGFGVPIGANGIVYRNRTLLVANSEKGQIVRIAVNKDGSPGTPEILKAASELLGADGLAFDVHGDLYIANSFSSQLQKIKLADLSLSVLASEGLDSPASLAFGTGRGARQDLYLTNFALLSGLNPGVVKVDVGVPGMPLP